MEERHDVPHDMQQRYVAQERDDGRQGARGELPPRRRLGERGGRDAFNSSMPNRASVGTSEA